MTTIDWHKTEAQMCLLQDKEIRKLIRYARRELKERTAEAWALKEQLVGAFAGLANVMAGASWAMACRESLRRSKDHTPTTGIRPASGEMWLPAETLKACRLDIKAQGWSALTAPNVTHFQAQYAALRKPPGVLTDGQAMSVETAMLGNAALSVAHFKVRMARKTASVLLESERAPRFPEEPNPSIASRKG